MWGLSLELGEARATWVFEQVSLGFQGRFIIFDFMFLTNKTHSHVYFFFSTSVTVSGTYILLELVQLVTQPCICTIYQDNNNKLSGPRLNKIH